MDTAENPSKTGVTWIPCYSLFAAILCGILSLWGWAIESSWLERFGGADQPVQPLAAIGYIALSVALFASMWSRPQIWAVTLAVPAAFIAVIIFQNLTGMEPGIEAWPFRSNPVRPQYSAAGQPFVLTLITLAALTFATGLAHRPGRRTGEAVIVLASIALSISLLSVCFGYLGPLTGNPGSEQFLPSVPTAMQAGFVAITLLVWPARFGGSDLHSPKSPQVKIMRRVFPFVLSIPAFLTLAEVTLTNRGVVAPIVMHVIAAAANITVLAIFLSWSMTQVSAARQALSEITQATDSVPIALTSLTGEITHWSQGCEELYGWSAEQMIGRRKYDVLKAFNAKSSIPLRRGRDVHHADRELVECRHDGTTVHVIERVRRVEVTGRAPVMVHSMIDISQRVAIEAALQESQASLKLALDAHQIGSFDWDMKKDNLAWSPGAEQSLGLRPGQINSFAAWARLVEPADVAAISNTIAAAKIAKSDRIRFHYHLHARHGGVRTIEGSARCFYNDSGRSTRMVGVNVDVTDRNEREATLLAHEKQLRSVLDTVPSAMVIFDINGDIKAFSASAERLFGYSAEEAMGQNIRMLIPSGPNLKYDEFMARYMTMGEHQLAGRTHMFSVQRRDGTQVPVELHLGVTNVGRQRLITGFCKDRSEQYAADQRVAEMHAELLHVSRLSAMGEMATGLSHELNQPLAAAVNFLAAADLLLADGSHLVSAQSFVRMAGKQALRAGDIIQRMREFIVKDEVDAQIVAVADIIEDAVSLMSVTGGQLDIELKYNLDPAATSVLADRVQIQQVLVNLLRNAADELRNCPPDQRQITIATARLAADMIEFSVADSGPGMDPDFIERLYIPFASTKGSKGLGVGLSISRRIIVAHGGTLSAENQPTCGAIFRFTLPSIDRQPGKFF